MNELDEDTALAIVFANTKRKKRNTDMVTIAQCFEFLEKLYGSRKNLSQKVGLSSEMIREFLTILKLPKEIQEMIHSRKIDSVDIARQIATIKDTKKQIVAAKLLVNSSPEDVRDIKRLINYADFSVEEAKKTVINSKPKGFHVFITDFDDKTYKLIKKYATSSKIKPAELIKEIVNNWLDKQEAKV